MLFNSLSYLLFFPAVVLVYYLIPFQKARNLLLLVARGQLIPRLPAHLLRSNPR